MIPPYKKENDAEKRSILKIPQLVSLEEYTRQSLSFGDSEKNGVFRATTILLYVRLVYRL
jgi:hypothetical protein